MDSIIGIPTLSDVIVRHQQNLSLTATRRRDLVSAVDRMSQITGADLGSTPASPQSMRPLIKAVRPAQHDLTPKTWANLRSNFRAALVQPMPRKWKHVDPEWDALRAALPDRRMRIGLSRFIGFCISQGIVPNEVCDAVVDRFRAHLESDTQVPDPNACHRTTCRVWNKAGETVSGWPQLRLSLPDYRRPRQSTPITSFPLSLQEEFAAYIDSLRGGDLSLRTVLKRRWLPARYGSETSYQGVKGKSAGAETRRPTIVALKDRFSTGRRKGEGAPKPDRTSRRARGRQDRFAPDGWPCGQS